MTEEDEICGTVDQTKTHHKTNWLSCVAYNKEKDPTMGGVYNIILAPQKHKEFVEYIRAYFLEESKKVAMIHGQPPDNVELLTVTINLDEGF